MLAGLLMLEGTLHWFTLRINKVATASVGDRLVSSAIVILFFFLPSLARTGLGLFACMTIDRPGDPGTALQLTAVGRFWLMDLQQHCFEGYHLGWSVGLGVPLLVFVCLLVPGTVLMLSLHRRRQPSLVTTFDRHYGFLYRTYKPSMCFWEAVVVLETIAFVAVSVFGHSLGSYYQIILMIFVLIIMLFMLVTFKPYAHGIAQRVKEGGGVLLIDHCLGIPHVPASRSGFRTWWPGCWGSQQGIWHLHGCNASAVQHLLCGICDMLSVQACGLVWYPC
eukprot:GHUV01009305.1.p1 GENE.GHUV01009305.1~~GHUV01009305.1.p1  ORF type:complete len:278 (+),score=34.00 GHUV01009305.1:350-1183(+)